ncbi:MAG: pentapeptide repeat-containing protein [Planctomycetaceae bacterium]|jgi:uncharacterized protein YjbI with pentapeptide repeats|nr:pentapeptide repeat-containing protein [Planctomycetaceae bacterium]
MTNINENNSTIDNTQSHWGNGVVLKNIQFGPPPADTENSVSKSETSAMQNNSKSVSLWSWFAVLFMALALCAGTGYLFSEAYDEVSSGDIINVMRWGDDIYDISPGAKVNGKILPFVSIPHTGDTVYYPTIKNVNFDDSLLGHFEPICNNVKGDHFSIPDNHRVMAQGVYYNGCSFKRTKFLDTCISAKDCDFQDALFIKNCSLKIKGKDLMLTANYKNKDISMCEFWNMDLSVINFSKTKFIYTQWYNCDLKGCDFSGADLRHSTMKNCDFENAIFTDAVITRIHFPVVEPVWTPKHPVKQITFEQIKQTKNYKTRNLNGCVFSGIDFRKADFSRFNLGMVVFQENTDVTGADFTDAIIASTDFSHVTGLSLKQIESTKSYKDGDRSSYKLPPDIQKALEEEKKAQGKER